MAQINKYPEGGLNRNNFAATTNLMDGAASLSELRNNQTQPVSKLAVCLPYLPREAKMIGRVTPSQNFKDVFVMASENRVTTVCRAPYTDVAGVNQMQSTKGSYRVFGWGEK